MTTTLTIKGTKISQSDLELKSAGELATAYNAAMYEIDPNSRKVDRFATKEVAVRRTWGAFVQLAALEATQPAEVSEPKAPKAKKEKAPKAEKATGSRTKAKDARYIVVATENPHRAGSWSHRSFEIIRANPGISFDELMVKGGRANTLRYDLRNGAVMKKA